MCNTNSIASNADRERNWVLQKDSDLSLLVDRIDYCVEIRDVVAEELALELLKSGYVEDLSDFLFAPCKELERSSYKLNSD